ncbi:hypothetical protein K7X08_005932 [Anisodus acutangulus]|uniref:VQ domain-containing protein n=1 Tax=Anisodus acutangulus TaxID=402998 RepID=A0A9Q1R7C9_9SOLA|nr:hypothetical protein K7X08_005932 [Anisodus acutangulus]
MFSDGRVSDTTVVTTTTTSVVSSNPYHHHGPTDGRVSKPIRKRSRASRRTPTTVLNTDTANFRAMVQQFTGGPVAPFASQGAYLGFGSNSIHQQQMVNPVTTVNSGAYNIQFQPQNQMFSSLGGTSTRPPAVAVQGRADNFLHILNDNSSARSSPSNDNKSENNFMF